MLGNTVRLLSRIRKLRNRPLRANHATARAGNSSPETAHVLSGQPAIDKKRIEVASGNSSDLVIREFSVGCGPGELMPVLLVHIDGLIDSKTVANMLLIGVTDSSCDWQTPAQAYAGLKNRLAMVGNTQEVASIDALFHRMASGHCAVLVSGIPVALTCDVRGWKERSIHEPTTEVTVRGSKEGFTETLRVNTSMLRRRIKDRRLRIEQLTIGRVSQTEIAVVYISGVANNKTVDEVKSRLERIDVASIQESGHLEEYIEDTPFSPFPTILRTERPDRVAGNLIEGRIAVLTDGTPFALVVPATFTMFLTTPEDYFERYYLGTAIRALRYLAFLISLTLPALYVAISTFHQEMLPTPLILSIASQRERIPFPAMVEALLMELVFEVLREAGLRLPRIVGQAVSVIGALVVGEAAMRAGLVSPAMVVVVAGTGIASFATPAFSIAVSARLLRFPLILLGGSLGLFGIGAGLMMLLIHLSALRSFGVPYMEPFLPLVIRDLKDAVLRVPWWAMGTRPRLVTPTDQTREAPGMLPKPQPTGRHKARRAKPGQVTKK